MSDNWKSYSAEADAHNRRLMYGLMLRKRN